MAPSDAEATRLKDEGNAFFKAGEYQAAIKSYTSSLELDPTQHLCFSNRSAAYLKSSAAEEALADAQKCVELAPAWAKGYSRQAAALQVLKRWDEAEECCSRGVGAAGAAGSDDVSGLRKMLSEVKTHRLQDALRGTWHGTVSEVLGGYDQEMEFLGERSVRVEVLGRSIVGKYWVDGGQDPPHLSIQVPMADQPPGMPPPLPVPYIARIDDAGLHLCCPFMKVERPTAFEGPGYCLMKKGPAGADAVNEVADLSRGERLLKCAQELVTALPDRKPEEVAASDEEEEAREKVMAQVRLESSMYQIQKRFGEETIKEVFSAAQAGADVPEGLKGTKELADLERKLKMCGFLDDPGPVQPEPPPPPPGPAKAVQRPKPAEAAAAPKPKPDKPEEADSGSDAGVPVAAIAIAAVAAAAVGLLLWRRSRK